jgi:hypothetical protein
VNSRNWIDSLRGIARDICSVGKKIIDNESVRMGISGSGCALSAGHITYNIAAPFLALAMPSYRYTVLWSSLELLSLSLASSLKHTSDRFYAIFFPTLAGYAFGFIYCLTACVAHHGS